MCYGSLMTLMTRKKHLMTVTVPPDLAALLEQWRLGHEFPPDRSAIVTMALREFFEKRGVQAKPVRTKKNG